MFGFQFVSTTLGRRCDSRRVVFHWLYSSDITRVETSVEMTHEMEFILMNPLLIPVYLLVVNM